MVRRTLLVLLSALALAAPTVTIPTATAEDAAAVVRPNRVTIADVTDDVWLWVPADKVWTEAGPWPRADNLQAVATHWGPKVGNRVVVTMDFADLQKSERQEFGVKITTPRLTRVAWVIVKPGRWKGYHLLELSSSKGVSAAGLTHRVNYRDDTVLVTIPRTRLGAPPWIRVAFVNLMFTAEGATFQDQPHDASFMTAATWSKHPPLSAKLYPVLPSSRPHAS